MTLHKGSVICWSSLGFESQPEAVSEHFQFFARSFVGTSVQQANSRCGLVFHGFLTGCGERRCSSSKGCPGSLSARGGGLGVDHHAWGDRDQRSQLR